MLSRLLRISYKSFVPRIFLNVVWASSLREFFLSILSILTQTSCWNERPRHWPHWWWRCWPCSTPPRPHSQWRCPWSTPDKCTTWHDMPWHDMTWHGYTAVPDNCQAPTQLPSPCIISEMYGRWSLYVVVTITNHPLVFFLTLWNKSKPLYM